MVEGFGVVTKFVPKFKSSYFKLKLVIQILFHWGPSSKFKLVSRFKPSSLNLKLVILNFYFTGGRCRVPTLSGVCRSLVFRFGS